MIIPTWVFGAVPLCLLGAVASITEAVKCYRERKLLHAVFDGDRIQAEQAWVSKRHEHFGGLTWEDYDRERRYY